MLNISTTAGQHEIIILRHHGKAYDIIDRNQIQAPAPDDHLMASVSFTS